MTDPTFDTLGDAATLIVTRDAEERADRLTDAESAIVLLDRARGSGDSTLVVAIRRRAVAMGWDSQTDAFDERTSQDLTDAVKAQRGKPNMRSPRYVNTPKGRNNR